jgi:hypothetical protein
MPTPQDWRTEVYKGMEVHVAALPHDADATLWDYTVRIAWPGEEAASESEIIAKAGDDADYPDKEAAIAAGLRKGYAMVDEATK